MNASPSQQEQEEYGEEDQEEEYDEEDDELNRPLHTGAGTSKSFIVRLD